LKRQFVMQDHAKRKRALARTLYSTIALSAASTGAIVGGPIGLAIGATVGTIAGKAAKDIDMITVTDEIVQSDIDETSFKHSVKESLITSVSGLASGALGKHASSFVMGSAGQAMMDGVTERLQRKLVEEGFDEVSDQTITT
jgi:hypothetical protein